MSARVDYAIRALVTLADAGSGPVKGEAMARVPVAALEFLQNILNQLRRAGLVSSQRGSEGGYRLARPAAAITLADVIRAIDGPLAEVRGGGPRRPSTRAGRHLQEVWVAVRASLRAVLENVTLADIAAGGLPPAIEALTADPDAWVPH